jgi:hypothetical protein
VPPLALSNETQTRTVLLMPATYITGCWGCQAKEQQKKKKKEKEKGIVVSM